ncbi:MAG: long-chain fatty acid--CoA ligase [Patescibacteria group bacterium]
MNRDLTLNNLFAKSFVENNHKTALVFYDREITYGKLFFDAIAFADFLRANNALPGSRVVLLLPNCPQFVIAYMGTLQAGCVVVALNPLVSSEEIVAMIKDADPEVIVTLKDFDRHNRFISENLSDKQRLVMVGLGEYLPTFLKIGYNIKNILKCAPWQGMSWKTAMNSRLDERIWPVVRPDNLAVLQFTGGTTGSPKAAMLTHSNLVNNALQALEHVGDLINENSVFLGVLPFFHVYGLSVCLNMALIKGCKIVIEPKFNSKRVLKLIEEKKVTIFPGIPRMSSALLKNERIHKTCFDSLKVCVNGAGALDPEIKKEFEQVVGVKVLEGYGLSEASPVVSINPFVGEKAGSLGLLLPGTVAKVAEGELFISGPQVMAGYWQKPEETQEVLKDGWLATGDMVRIDKDGFLWMEDRKKDMIKIRGENVYSQEVEKVIMRHPSVEEAAVIGLPDKDLGEKIVACVVLKSDWSGKTTEADIQDFCRKNLPKFKTPKEIKIFMELPKNILGKVLKKELRKILNESR